MRNQRRICGRTPDPGAGTLLPVDPTCCFRNDCYLSYMRACKNAFVFPVKAALPEGCTLGSQHYYMTETCHQDCPNTQVVHRGALEAELLQTKFEVCSKSMYKQKS